MDWPANDFGFARPCWQPFPGTLEFQLVGDPGYVAKGEDLYVYWYGTTIDGKLVRVRTRDKLPYMMSLAPVGTEITPGYLETLATVITAKLKETHTWGTAPTVLRCSLVSKRGLFGLSTEPVPMIRYDVNVPAAIPKLRKLINSGGLKWMPTKCFNADIDFTWRCMIDQGFSMGQWIRLVDGSYTVKSHAEARAELQIECDQLAVQQANKQRKRAAQNSEDWGTRKKRTVEAALAASTGAANLLCVECSLGSMVQLNDREEHAPLRILTTDIECKGRRGVFPEADKDQVICIGNQVNIMGVGERFSSLARGTGIKRGLNPRKRDDAKKLMRAARKAAFTEGFYVLFHLRDCDPSGMPKDKPSYCFPCVDEAAMLLAYSSFLQWLRPEFVLTWNGHGFDFPFLSERSKVLGVGEQFHNSGDADHPLILKKSTFQNKAYGQRSGYEVLSPGITFYDVMQVDQREFKRRSYALNFVANAVLGVGKDDLHHTQIGPLFEGNTADRTRLYHYCLIDCARTFEVQFALQYVMFALAMARVTGCSPHILMARGTIARSYLFLCRECEADGYAVDYLDRSEDAEDDEDGFEGAHVFDPVKGLHPMVITLDFASLYPSIIQAYNLCWSTEIKADKVAAYPPDKVIKTPIGAFFATKELQEGVIPKMERKIVAQRSGTKRRMADAYKEGDFAAGDNLERKQLGEKVLANGTYGVTGTKYRAPNMNVAASVTAIGRELIQLAAKSAIEILRGEDTPWGRFPESSVVYGDTDSIMVRLGGDVEKLSQREMVDMGCKVGKWLASTITRRHFPAPIALEWEKVYAPMMLLNKKRYAGLYWTNAEEYDRVDSKGMESKRRDNSMWEHQIVCNVVDDILLGAGTDAAVKRAQDAVTRLYMREVPLDDLVITAQISRKEKDYKTVTKTGAKRPKPAQVVANAEIRRREGDGGAFQTGDRVPYVVVPGAPGSNKVEHVRYVEYARQEGQYGDIAHYLERLCKSLTRIFDPICGLGFAKSKIINGPHTLKRAKSSFGGPMARFLSKGV